MSRARVTINAAVLATAIWIHTRLETNIGAVVAGDDASRTISKILGYRFRPLPWHAVAMRRRLIAKIDINNIDIG